MQSLSVLTGFMNRKAKPAYFFFFGVTLTASFSALPAEKTGCLEAGMLMGLPVWGLRPLRSLRARTWKVPKPMSWTLPPLASSFCMLSTTASIAIPAAFFVLLVLAATEAMSSVLFIWVHTSFSFGFRTFFLTSSAPAIFLFFSDKNRKKS